MCKNSYKMNKKYFKLQLPKSLSTAILLTFVGIYGSYEIAVTCIYELLMCKYCSVLYAIHIKNEIELKVIVALLL